MERFLESGVDRSALLRDLAPHKEDFAAVFTGALLEHAPEHYRQVSRTLEIKPPETELLMWRATSEELRDASGDALKCPAQYRDVGPYLRPGVVWYCFRFVKPAEKVGTMSEGLVFVNGRWVLMAAPWEALP